MNQCVNLTRSYAQIHSSEQTAPWDNFHSKLLSVLMYSKYTNKLTSH